MEELMQSLRKDIIEQLNLQHIGGEVGVDDPLFGEGWGLDSIDALELIVLLERKYGLKVRSAEEGKHVLKSIRTISEYIRANPAG